MASFRSVGNRRRRATPVITSTFENASDMDICLGLSLGPPAKPASGQNRGQFRFALLEAEMVMAQLLSCYTISLPGARPVLPVGRVTIEPSYEPLF
jgi:hypothetical protein